MTPVYWILFLLVMLVQLISPLNRANYKIKLFISLFLVFVFGALRVDFGNDYDTYQAFFDNVKVDIDYNERMEIGYRWLNYLLPNFRVLIILTTLLVCLAYYRTIENYVTYQYIPFCLFLLFLAGDKSIFFMFSGIRNSITIALLLLSIKWIIDRELIKFALLTILAATFHSSALLVFPVFYIVGGVKSFNTRNVVLFVGAFLFLIIFSAQGLLNIMGGFLLSNFERYESYIENANMLGDQRGILINISSLALFFMLLYFACKSKLSPKETQLVSMAFLFVFSYTLGTLNLRLSQYSLMFFVIGVVVFMRSCKSIMLKIVFISLVIAFFVYSLYIYISMPAFPYEEYKSIFNH